MWGKAGSSETNFHWDNALLWILCVIFSWSWLKEVNKRLLPLKFSRLKWKTQLWYTTIECTLDYHDLLTNYTTFAHLYHEFSSQSSSNLLTSWAECWIPLQPWQDWHFTFSLIVLGVGLSETYQYASICYITSPVSTFLPI